VGQQLQPRQGFLECFHIPRHTVGRCTSLNRLVTAVYQRQVLQLRERWQGFELHVDKVQLQLCQG